MADPLGAAPSIVGIVEFGLQLAAALHILVELAWEARESLIDTVFDVNATALTLRQLQDVISADREGAKKNDSPGVFKDAGRVEINSLAVKCEQVYKILILLVRKARELAMDKTTAVSTSIDPDELDSVALDPSSIQTLSVSHDLSWLWLRPRISRCQEQLRWLNMSLLFNLQLATLAGLQIKSAGERQRGTFEEEFQVRTAAQTLRFRRAKYSTRMAQKGVKLSQNDMDGEKSPAATAGESDDPPVANSHNRHIPSESTESPAARQNARLNAITPQLASIAETKEEDLDKSTVDTSSEATVNDVPEVMPDHTSEALEPSGKIDQPMSQQERQMTSEGLEATALRQAQIQAGSPAATILKIPSFFTQWSRGIFGKEDRFHGDWESTELQAFIAREDGQESPIKIPFGHQQLKYGLDRIKKGRKGTQWIQYLELSSRQRQTIDDVTVLARSSAPRYEQTCVAVELLRKQGGPPYMLIFFSLSEPPSPIYLADAVGRHFTFPYEQCRTWEGMKRLLDEAFTDAALTGPPVQKGHFDLLIGNDTVLPSLWSASIKPGTKVRMLMWPMERMFLPGQARPPYPGMAQRNPGTPAGLRGSGPGIRPGIAPGGRPSPAPSGLAGKSNEADVKLASRNPPPSRHIIKPDPEPRARSNAKISAEEKRALTIVDFSEEAGKADFSVEELLSRFTNATDTEGTFLTLRDCDSDSDTSSMGSFSSRSSDGL